MMQIKCKLDNAELFKNIVKVLSKQNTEASLASLSCNSSRGPTEWSTIFAFGVCYIQSVETVNKKYYEKAS